jgi:hypothetical protein
MQACESTQSMKPGSWAARVLARTLARTLAQWRSNREAGRRVRAVVRRTARIEQATNERLDCIARYARSGYFHAELGAGLPAWGADIPREAWRE